MRIEAFKNEFRDVVAVPFGADHALFRQPLRLINLETGKERRFKSLEDALDVDVEGKTIAEYIEEMDHISFEREGGRGGSSGLRNGENESTFKFGHAPHGRGSGNDVKDLPAKLNVRIPINGKSPERALEEFRKLHALSNTEFGVTVDPQGFITQYVRGGATSVGIWGKKGEMVYHNHPSGGAFSDSDLLSTAMSAEKGIVASGKNGDYIFVKNGGHFKAAAFMKAVRSAKMKGTSYDDAVDKWLTANQKKYGYTYVFKKA